MVQNRFFHFLRKEQGRAITTASPQREHFPALRQDTNFYRWLPSCVSSFLTFPNQGTRIIISGYDFRSGFSKSVVFEGGATNRGAERALASSASLRNGVKEKPVSSDAAGAEERGGEVTTAEEPLSSTMLDGDNKGSLSDASRPSLTSAPLRRLLGAFSSLQTWLKFWFAGDKRETREFLVPDNFQESPLYIHLNVVGATYEVVVPDVIADSKITFTFPTSMKAVFDSQVQLSVLVSVFPHPFRCSPRDDHLLHYKLYPPPGSLVANPSSAGLSGTALHNTLKQHLSSTPTSFARKPAKKRGEDSLCRPLSA